MDQEIKRVAPPEMAEELRWQRLSALGIQHPSGLGLKRDLTDGRKVLCQRAFNTPVVRSIEASGKRLYEFYAATSGVKRDGNAIDHDGWVFDDFVKYPPFLFQHDYSGLPIGTHMDWGVDRVSLREPCLRTVVDFVPKDIYPFADTVRRMYDGGYMRAVSAGWIPERAKQTKEGLLFTRNRLIEVSGVTMPCDPDAVGTFFQRAMAQKVISNDDLTNAITYVPHIRAAMRAAPTCAYVLSSLDPEGTEAVEGESRMVGEFEPQSGEIVDSSNRAAGRDPGRLTPTLTKPGEMPSAGLESVGFRSFAGLYLRGLCAVEAKVRGEYSDQLDVAFDKMVGGLTTLLDVVGDVRSAVAGVYYREADQASSEAMGAITTEFAPGGNVNIYDAMTMERALKRMRASIETVTDAIDEMESIDLKTAAVKRGLPHEVRTMSRPVQTRIGKMLSMSNLQKIQAALDNLQALVDAAAGPQQGDSEDPQQDPQPEENPEEAPAGKPPAKPQAPAQGQDGSPPAQTKEQAAVEDTPLTDEEDALLQQLLRRKRRAGGPESGKVVQPAGDKVQIASMLQKLHAEVRSVMEGLEESETVKEGDPEAQPEEAPKTSRRGLNLAALMAEARSVLSSQ